MKRKPLARSRMRRRVQHDPLWDKAKRTVLLRAKGWCEACRRRAVLDVHHVTKRSQGGEHDPDQNLIALCRTCHDRTDWAFSAGRLVIEPLGEGKFHCEVVFARDKWEAREARG